MAWADGKPPPDFEARLAFIPTDAGGRKGPAYGADGMYRPILDLGQGELRGCICEFVGAAWVKPGDEVDARFWFIFPSRTQTPLQVGLAFMVQERQPVATGRISRVLNRALQ